MARSFALFSLPTWLRVAAWLRREHVAARTRGGADRRGDAVGHRHLRRPVRLVPYRRRRRSGPRPALPRRHPAAAARRAGGAAPRPAGRGALAELGRLAPARPPRRPVQPGRGGAGDRRRGVLGRLPPLWPRGLVQRAHQRRAHQLAERRALLPRGAQGDHPRRRAGDGGRHQPRRPGAGRHAGRCSSACSTPRPRCAR